jgi:hypothetical protein
MREVTSRAARFGDALLHWIKVPLCGFELSPIYLYVSRVAGALMFGWTVLLFWAQLKPITRADVLLITLFPAVAILTVAANLIVQANQISFANMAPLFIVYAVLFAMILPAYAWAKRQPPVA